MTEITSPPAQYGNTDNTLLLKWATMVQGGVTPPLVATSLIFSTQPAGAVAGSPFTTQPVVTVKDQNGATLTSFTGNVTIALQSGTGTLSGTLVKAAVAGVATFTDLELDTPGNFVLRASIASPVLSVDSNSFLVFPVTALRLQTHLPGSGDVVLGLYKDVLCTDPVTEEGDVVAGVKDEIGSLGIMAVQSVLASRPMALLDEDGNWVLDYDGIDDWLLWDVGAKGGVTTYSALFRSNTGTFNNYWGIIDNADASSAAKEWAYFDQGTHAFFASTATAVNKEGVALSAPFDLGTITDLMVVTVTTRNATSASRGIGQLAQTYYGNFQLVALIVHDAADTALVQSYLQTLK